MAVTPSARGASWTRTASRRGGPPLAAISAALRLTYAPSQAASAFNILAPARASDLVLQCSNGAVPSRIRLEAGWTGSSPTLSTGATWWSKTLSQA